MLEPSTKAMSDLLSNFTNPSFGIYLAGCVAGLAFMCAYVARISRPKKPSTGFPEFPKTRKVILEKPGLPGRAQPCSTDASFQYQIFDIYNLGADGASSCAEHTKDSQPGMWKPESPVYVHPTVPDYLPEELWMPDDLSAARYHNEPSNVAMPPMQTSDKFAPNAMEFYGHPHQQQHQQQQQFGNEIYSPSHERAPYQWNQIDKEDPLSEIESVLFSDKPPHRESVSSIGHATSGSLPGSASGSLLNDAAHGPGSRSVFQGSHGDGLRISDQSSALASSLLMSSRVSTDSSGRNESLEPLTGAERLSVYSPPSVTQLDQHHSWHSPPELLISVHGPEYKSFADNSTNTPVDSLASSVDLEEDAGLNMKPYPHFPMKAHHEQRQQQYNKQKARGLQIQTKMSRHPQYVSSSLPSPPHSSRGVSDSGSDTNDDQTFKCPDCSATFRIRGYLTRHMKKHAEIMKFNCPFYQCLSEDHKCHQTGGFSRRDTFKMHLKARHFAYPNGTSRKNRPNRVGRCCGCNQLFENNETWIENHLLAGLCPMDKVDHYNHHHHEESSYKVEA